MIIDITPSKKKPCYEVLPKFRKYLKRYGRLKTLPLKYADLLRFTVTTPLLDKNDNDTLWQTIFFDQYDTTEIHQKLKEIYAILKTDGDLSVIEHLWVSRIDYCTFGNSKPFRVRIINRLNDNYDHIYVKTADASRIYGLELEHILSPNRITFIVDGDTLIEEHIPGIPGDIFINDHMLHESVFNKTRIAKEFVKFNERCFARLLGDMRSYNFVVQLTPDIEGNQYHIRAIDFDQQSYEGRKNIYLPQFFKENLAMVQLGATVMNAQTMLQYQQEERTMTSQRVKSSKHRIKDLLDIMSDEKLSSDLKIDQLKIELTDHHHNNAFVSATTKGQLVKQNLRLLLRRSFKYA